jgi:hypothetical protein
MPSMRAPGGWRVEAIAVERGSWTLHRYRVSRHRVFVGEVPITADPARDLARLAALGVPVDQLVED